MILPLFKKELNDYRVNKTTLVYFTLLSILIAYSFYSAINLYSKASIAAIDNPIYAQGFEPLSGVFNPTFGALFMILSLFAPFLFTSPITKEKKNNTFAILIQSKYGIKDIFIAKTATAIVILFFSILLFSPLFLFWKTMGGHIPINEILLLMFGYTLFGLFVISVSFFSASIFNSSQTASIVALIIIISSWFIDFGKEMNIAPILRVLENWSITIRLKDFENSIFSLRSIGYFLLLSSLFVNTAYTFFNINYYKKIKRVLIIIIIHIILFFSLANIHFSRDISESKKNSFPINETKFLQSLPSINIRIFLEPTDSRYKDFENDFLKKISMIKNDITVTFIKGDKLQKNYGIFIYTLNNKSLKTYSNNKTEIFMLLQEMSKTKIEDKANDANYRGYPLVVKSNWNFYFFTLYLLLFPLFFIIIHLKQKNIRVNHEK